MKCAGMVIILVAAVFAAAAAGAGDPGPAGPGPSDQVIGLALGGEQRAYPLTLFDENPVVNDEVGHMAVVVFYNREGGNTAAFFRLISGEPLEFSGRAPGGVADDLTTATRWDMSTGQAVGGNLVGQKLIPIPARKQVYADWRTRYPKGTIFARQ
jgi:hypothetical protein